MCNDLSEFCSRYHLKVPHIDQDLLCELYQYPFPGNARELRNLVERALIINRDERLGFDDFPDLNIIPQEIGQQDSAGNDGCSEKHKGIDINTLNPAFGYLFFSSQ